MRDHGNYDYVHGQIRPDGVHKFEQWNGTPFRRQEVDRLWKEANGDRCLFTPAKQIAYCELAQRGHCVVRYLSHKRQHLSDYLRRQYRSAANKKTRQWLKEEMKKELHDVL